jgi:hypothetical protein
MIRRKKQSRKYHAPSAKVTQMALESNFCQTVRFNVQVKELENMNDPNDPDGVYNGESFYFES